jgi:predicted metal-dependent peptidase
MEFRVVGKIDKSIVKDCEDRMSKMFLILGMNPKASVQIIKDQEGVTGDPLVFNLLVPFEHVLTNAISTAATDGKRFYWNPTFIRRQTPLGLRFVAAHEASHAFLMHPDRLCGRIPKLWNIAVDYIVNGMVMDDLKHRGKNPGEVFETHLGKFATLDQYAEMIKNPFSPSKKTAELFEAAKKAKSFNSGVVMPDPKFEGELTPEQLKESDRRASTREGFFFADPDMEDEMKSPEKIYAYLYKLLPKCPECGRVGMYKKPKSEKDNNKSDKGDKKDKGKKGDKGDKGDQAGDQSGDQPGDQGQNGKDGSNGSGSCCGDQNGQGSGQGSGQGECNDGQCGSCGDGDSFDIFDLGDTLDEHMSTEEDKEKLAQRLASAIEQASRMAGYIPAGLQGELNQLSKPVIKWQDSIKSKMSRVRQGNARNDWSRFKTRPLSYQCLIPKRKEYFIKFAALLDTSGSMSDNDIVYGVSQLQSLDSKAEGWIVPADGDIYWDDAVEIKKCDEDSLRKTKVVGRGGTAFMNFTNDYKEHFGDVDLLIIITDGFIYDMAGAQDPRIPVYWIITSDHADFKPPFGKAFLLRNGQTEAK